MKITTKNYFKAISEVGFDNLPEVLKKSHLVIQEKTNNGNDWGLYDNDPEVKRVFDLAFEKLYEFIDRKDNLAGLDGNPLIERAKKDATGYKNLPLDKLKMIYRLEQDAELEDGLTPEIKIRKAALEKAIAAKEGKPKGNLGMAKNKYSEISQEIKFILRYLDFHDKVLYKNTIGLFIDDLQNAITEKKITKKSPVAKEIMEMQDSALKAFNSMRNAKHIMLRPETIKKLKAIIEKYENAYDDIDEQYAKSKKEKKNLNGLGNTPVNIMSSKDFTNLKFNTLGFEGKWLEFIGDPAPGFTAMVFGMPKMGKSYLCVDFAGYLARNHGKVLYVAKEEKLDATLQKKLKDKDVAHENLFVSDALPSDLSAYDFIFLDSVNKIGLTPKDLEKLKADNKGKSFIYIFQATKGGKFKGNNEFQHDVDVVIEIPEQGKATQYGRFNQGGELNIFEDKQPVTLQGIEKSGKGEKIFIKPTFSVPLEEFDFLIERGESVQEAIRLHKSDAERWVKKLVETLIKEEQAKVKVEDVYFMANDDEADEESEGLSYYDLRISGEENELRKVANKDKDLYYVWSDKEIGGTSKKSRKNLDVQKKVSNVDTMKKKTTTTEDWTEPEHLDKQDHAVLKEINRLYKAKKYKEAMNRAMDADTIIREEIPPEIWKKMGGQLTKTGEERLRERQGKAGAHSVHESKQKSRLVFNGTVRILKGVIEREWDLELTDSEYIEILEIAEDRSVNFTEAVNEMNPNLNAFLIQMAEALKIWDRQNAKSGGKSRAKFDPRFYENRPDDDNPSYIFSLTSNKLLSEAIEGDFDLIYLVRRELANRGLDSKGKWVGFDEAKRIHRI